MESFWCIKCGEEREPKDFERKSQRTASGIMFSEICNICNTNYKKDWYHKNLKHISEEEFNLRWNTKYPRPKVCSRCGTMLTEGSYHGWCRECKKQYEQKYRLTHLNQEKINNKKNREKFREINKNIDPYIQQDYKICGSCRLNILSIYFRVNNSSSSGLHSTCKICVRMAQAERRGQPYGITAQDFWNVLDKQQGLCKICKKFFGVNLHIDHDHQTGKFRALLCLDCNTGFGKFYEDISILESAILYKKEFSK